MREVQRFQALSQREVERAHRLLKFKGSELAPLGTFEKKVPAELVAKVKAREKDIHDGKFSVKVDDGQPKGSAK